MNQLNKLIESKTGIKTHGKYNERNIMSMSDTPKDEEESRDYANALYSSGYYPAGLNGCFTVGISGGCGLDCWVYLDGNCDCPDEMIDRLETEEDKELHYKLYKSS